MSSLYTRRSIRKYTGEFVHDEQLMEALRAGMHAPSAGNRQPWAFVLIRDRQNLQIIAETNSYSKMLTSADVAILVCADTMEQKDAGYYAQACSAATENILLSLDEQGLGGVWLGIYPSDDKMKLLTRLCRLPDHIVPFALISVGHPAETPSVHNRFKPDRIHHDVWERQL